MAQKQLKEETVLEIEEIDQSDSLVAKYLQSPGDGRSSRFDVVVPKSTNSYGRRLVNIFLPRGYPQSVTQDYLEYQIYDSLQAFSSSIAGMLSSRAVLEGIGVGDSHASPTAALLLSVLQESMGRVATILFAHRLGTSLEPECKLYRLLADIFNDAAMILDCLSPALPKPSRVALLSLSSVLRSLCGVAAGSSKASLSAHFATQGNLGELNAKDSSQETIISLMGMLAGSVVVSHITSKWLTWISLLFLLSVHLGTNYMAVRAVCMRTLNRQRANLVLSSILDTIEDDSEGLEGVDRSRLASYVKVPSIEAVSRRERIFERDGVLRWQGDEILGSAALGIPFHTIMSCFGPRDASTGSLVGAAAEDLTELLEIFQESKFIVWYDRPRKTFLIALKEGSQTRDQLMAWMFTLYIARYDAEDIGGKDAALLHVLDETLEWVVSIQEEVISLLEAAGWDTKISALETHSGTRIRLPTS